jgi:hypothetical protein
MSRLDWDTMLANWVSNNSGKRSLCRHVTRRVKVGVVAEPLDLAAIAAQHSASKFLGDVNASKSTASYAP